MPRTYQTQWSAFVDIIAKKAGSRSTIVAMSLLKLCEIDNLFIWIKYIHDLITTFCSEHHLTHEAFWQLVQQSNPVDNWPAFRSQP